MFEPGGAQGVPKNRMDEGPLLLGLRNGNPAAWRELVESTGDRLFRAANLMCANHHDAEDVVQETYLRFAESLGRFQGRSTLYTWMYGILLNIVRRRRHIASRFVVTDSPPEAEAAKLEPGSAMDAGTTSQLLVTALQKLTPDHRDIMILRYYDQMTVEDIAATLGISTGTVKSRLFHARREMSGLLPESLNPFKA